MASPVNSVGSNNNDSSNTANMLGSTAPSEQMFLQLLVAQLQNQDPLNPTDSTQFVSQLAQFSSLEQMMQIRSNTDTLVADASTAAAAAAASAASNTTAGQTPAANQTN